MIKAEQNVKFISGFSMNLHPIFRSGQGQIKVRLRLGQCSGQVKVRSRLGQGARIDGLDFTMIQVDLIQMDD